MQIIWPVQKLFVSLQYEKEIKKHTQNNKTQQVMARRKQIKKKYKVIEGVLYKSINSNYDGRVIGWIEA